MIGSGRKEGWPECFQDLGSWCQPPQDELHTPKVNIQDEFNFSIDDGHANEWDLLSSPVECDPWGNDTQFGISTCQPIVREVNSSSTVQEGVPLGVISKTPNILGSGGKLLCTITADNVRSPLKSKGNVLLSQGILKGESADDSPLLNMAAATTMEHTKTNNKPVVITNDCYLLPIAVPEFASAKLNSSSFIIPSLQSQLSTPTMPIKKVPKENTMRVINNKNILNDLRVKEEEQGKKDGFTVTNNNDDITDRGNTSMIGSPPVAHPSRPQLKINIAAANNQNKVTSTLSTPEVLRLVNGDNTEFNLLQYVCDEDDYSELIQEVEEEDKKSVAGDQAIRDHDYTDSWSTGDLKSDVVIKSEPGSPSSTSCSFTNQSLSKGRPRRRKRDDSSDYVVSESDDTSEDDSQQEWSPTPVKRKKRKTSISTSKTNHKSSTASSSNAGKRGSRRSSNQSNNQEISSNNGQDKYRALRERNNEASRRSRMNRKQKDVEMLQMAEELYKKNVFLKARAEKMENLVKYMRAEIMKALTKPK